MKKIAIVTFQKSYNYGALLQAFATQKVVEKMGFDSELIDYANPDEKKENVLISYKKDIGFKNNIKNIVRNVFLFSYFIRKHNFEPFFKKMKMSKPLKYDDDLDVFFNHYDSVIAGSDQIWNPVITGGKLEKVFLLDFKANNKLSYASSCGSYKYKSEKEYIKKCLSDFSVINVREPFLQVQLQNMGIKNVNVVLDPTLLLNRKDWESICFDNFYTDKLKDKYILVYLLQPYNNYCADVLKLLKEKFGYKIVNVGFSLYKKKNIDINLLGVTPERFISLVANAEIVVTDSFHGTAFSVNFNKNFYSILNPKNPKRVENFLDMLDLTKRIVKSVDNIELIEEVIDYSKANNILSTKRGESLEFLRKGIINET